MFPERVDDCLYSEAAEYYGGMDRASLERSDEDDTGTGKPTFLSTLISLNLATHCSIIA